MLWIQFKSLYNTLKVVSLITTVELSVAFPTLLKMLTTFFISPDIISDELLNVSDTNVVTFEIVSEM